MTLNKSLKTALLIAVAGSLACMAVAAPREKKESAAEPAATAAAAGDSSAAAQIAGETITMAALDEAISAQMVQMKEQLFQMRMSALEAMIADKLFNAEAKKQSISVEALLKKEVEDKIAAVTDAEISEFFEGNKNRMAPTATLEQYSGQIRTMLEGQRKQKAEGEYVASLKKMSSVKILLEPIRYPVSADDDATFGSPDAPISIVEFSDFQCPFCSRVMDTMAQIEKAYGKLVKVTFRDFPLEMHKQAQKAAEAAECAGDQGKFWEMHDAMFSNQRDLSIDGLKKLASGVGGVDATKFNECLDSGKNADEVQADMKDGANFGVRGTPAFFVNGRSLSGAQPFENFKTVIDDELSRMGITVPSGEATPAAASTAKPSKKK